MGGRGCRGSVVPAPGPSPQPGALRREAGTLMEDLTPVAACPPEEVPSLSLLPEVSPGPQPGLPPPDRSAQALTPHSSLHCGCEGMWGQEGGDPRQDLHRRFWDTPIYSLPGKPEARVPLSRFPAPGPSQGGWRPPESGAIRAVHRGGGQTFRPPIPAPSIPGFPRLLGGGEGCSPRGVRISPGEALPTCSWGLSRGSRPGLQTRRTWGWGGTS